MKRITCLLTLIFIFSNVNLVAQDSKGLEVNYTPTELIGPIKVADLDFAEEFKNSIVLFVLLENPCPNCTKKEINKSDHFSVEEKLIAVQHGKLNTKLSKSFESYKGRYEIIKRSEITFPKYNDIEKYRYVYFMFTSDFSAGQKFNNGQYQSDYDFDSTWILLDRGTNVGYNIVRSNIDSGSFLTTPKLGVQQFNKFIKM